MNEEQIFLAALRRGMADRAAFLAEACGADVALRKRLVARLADEDRSLFNFLNEPSEPSSVLGTLTLPLTGSETWPRLLGDASDLQSGSMIASRYKLEALLGEGGMGEVWIARQEEPVRRRVAVKLIKSGLASRETLARFEQERQALALMDHPSMAKVLDAGFIGVPGASATEVRPFFVMELVEGQPLGRFCDEAKLTLSERLELFVPICQAVQHAHQKGIIHRDLKPSNILVTRVDGKPVPKVIDFGVAKAALGKLSCDTLATQFGTLVGTLEYMAPEQASMSGMDVDTRADIYSLGVILYELLTGLRPFDPERLRSLPFDEVLRVLREDEPPRPSTRLAAEPGRSRLAHLRGTDAPRAVAELRGDLDWIILKCLEKDRARRYESVNGLARDIQRYLDNEAVEAVPPTVGYRLRKFLLRHRGGVIAASLLFLALLAGVVGTTWGLLWALREKDAKESARLEAVAAESRAKQAAADERRANELAHDRLLRVEKANSILAAIFHDVDPRAEEQGGPGLRAQLGEQLAAAAELIGGGKDSSVEVTGSLKHKLGVALRNLDQAKAAFKVLKGALAIREEALGEDHPDTLCTRYELAQVYLLDKEPKTARPILEDVLKRRRQKLGPDDPETLRTMGSLAWCCKEMGDVATAMPLAEETLERQNRVLGREHDDTIASVGRLAILHLVRGDYPRASKLLDEAYQGHLNRFGPDHYKSLISACNLALALREINEMERAVQLYEDSYARFSAKVGPDHVSTLVCGSGLADTYRLQGQFEKALPIAESVTARAVARLGKDHPQTQVFRNNLALLYEKTGKLDQAIAIHRELLADGLARFGSEHPDNITSKTNLAFCLRELKQFDEAIRLYREAFSSAQKLYGANHPDVQGMAANFGMTLIQAGQGAEAEAILRACQATLKDKPINFGTHRLKSLLGGALLVQKKYAEAEPLLHGACVEMIPLAGGGFRRERLAEAIQWLILCYQETGKTEAAAEWQRKLEELTKPPAGKP